MITPRFSCAQIEETLTVSIYCPAVRASDVEINVDDTLFTIHVNPYYLRLNFSHSLLEDDESSARYDPSSGYLTVTLTKAVKGQVFEDLDLLSKLLAPRPSIQPPEGPLIEVLDSTASDETPNVDLVEDELVEATQNLSLEHQEILEAAENDWQLKQDLQSPSSFRTRPNENYGFLEMYTGYFINAQYSENEVNELGPDAEICTKQERRQRRLEHEDKKWDGDHYMADFADDDYIRDELIPWQHPHNIVVGEIVLTNEEELAILRLPRKEYLPTSSQTHNLYLTLLTVLFAYAYDSRTTQHDPTPESGWTTSVLVPAFSALDPPPYITVPGSDDLSFFSLTELASTFVASYRRALAFPLYRSFMLVERCRSDVADFLTRGKRSILRCLLEVKNILDHHDVYYVYSKIWLDDFCVWIQAGASDEILRKLGNTVQELEIKKDAIGWGLEELEALTQQETPRRSDSDDESEDEVERMLPAPL